MAIRGVEKETIKDATITNPQTAVDTIIDENDPSREIVEKEPMIKKGMKKIALSQKEEFQSKLSDDLMIKS